MHPIAAWLALNGWEPYITGKGRYVFVGAQRGAIHREMVMMWPEVGVNRNPPVVQLVAIGTPKNLWVKREWEQVPEDKLLLVYALLKGE